MTKLSCLLFFCLFAGSRLFAQADSSKPASPPPATVEKTQDTTTAPAVVKQVARHRDSTHSSRHDSTHVTRQPKRDSALAAFRRDSIASASAAVIAVADSVRSASVPVKKGPDETMIRAIATWKAALAANPSFNFLGKPVVESSEVHRPNSKDSLFYLIVGILFYFALIRIFFEKYFGNLMTLFFKVSLRQQQIREQVLQTPLPSLLLNLLFIISGGLYACFLLHYSRFGPDMNFWLLYLDCMAGLGVIYLVKFMTLKFCGWVFNISRGTDTYIFIVFLVNKMLGIFLLPFLILITFSGPTGREIFITISLAMVFVLLAYRVMASYPPVRNEIKLTPFHFFLYLCAFEIAPLLLIYKVLLTYLEKVY